MTYLFVFIWLGSIFPEQYKQVITDCQSHQQNKCVLLNQTDWEYYFKKYQKWLDLSQPKMDSIHPVQRADVLRLLYLYENGGIYTDLDNIIDYDCLYKFLEGKPEFFFGQEQWRKEIFPSNFFIYTARPEIPHLKYLITHLKYCAYCPILQFAGPYMLKRQQMVPIDMKQCIFHKYDSKWQIMPSNKLYYIIAGIVGIILILVVVAFCKYKKRKNQSSQDSQPINTNETPISVHQMENKL